MTHPLSGVLLAALTILGMGGACAQDYPGTLIRIVTSIPGLGVELAARIIAPSLSENLGQQVIVVNTPGGGPASGEAVAQLLFHQCCHVGDQFRHQRT